jgi:hypothetical protein
MKNKVLILVLMLLAVVAISSVSKGNFNITGATVWYGSITDLSPKQADFTENWTVFPEKPLELTANMEEANLIDSAYIPEENTENANLADTYIYKFSSESAAQEAYNNYVENSAVDMSSMGTPAQISSGSSDTCSASKIVVEGFGELAISNCIKDNVVYEVQTMSKTGQAEQYLQQINSAIDNKF